MSSRVIFIGQGKPTFPIPKHYMALGEEFARRGYIVHHMIHHHHRVNEKLSNPFVHYWPWWTGPQRYIRDFYFVVKSIRKYKPVCVIAGHRETKILILAGFLLRVPVRVIYHRTLTTQIDLDAKRSRWVLLGERVLRIPLYRNFATHAVGVSSEAARDLQRVFRVPKRKIILLHNTLADPLENGPLETILSGEPEERIVCIGRLDASKGQDLLIRAVAVLKDRFPKIRVHFVGDGPYKDDFLKLCNDLELDQHCVFVGRVPHNIVLQYMASSSFTVCPSYMDNLPMIVIESLAVGKAIIASNVGGIPDMVIDGIQGFLIPPRDIDAMVEKMLELLSETHRREQMEGEARQHFLSFFSQKTGISKQVDWFEEIMGSTNTRDLLGASTGSKTSSESEH